VIELALTQTSSGRTRNRHSDSMKKKARPNVRGRALSPNLPGRDPNAISGSV
jgi:hypothetical protein